MRLKLACTVPHLWISTLTTDSGLNLSGGSGVQPLGKKNNPWMRSKKCFSRVDYKSCCWHKDPFTLYNYWLVPRQHWKIMPRSCAMLPEGLRPKGNITQLRSIIFQCWLRLTVNIIFVISRNKCNTFASSTMIQIHRICIDPPNTAVGPKKIDANAWCHMAYTMFPGNMNHVMPCSLGTWCCPDKTGQRLFFAHHMTRVGPITITWFRSWCNNIPCVGLNSEPPD